MGVKVAVGGGGPLVDVAGGDVGFGPGSPGTDVAVTPPPAGVGVRVGMVCAAARDVVTLCRMIAPASNRRVQMNGNFKVRLFMSTISLNRPQFTNRLAVGKL